MMTPIGEGRDGLGWAGWRRHASLGARSETRWTASESLRIIGVGTLRSIRVTGRQAHRSAVWAVPADFPSVSTWNGGVKASRDTGEVVVGVGAWRYCDPATPAAWKR